MTCKEFTEAVTDYLEERLSLGDHARATMHLGTCAVCRTYLRQMQQTIETLGRLPKPPVSSGVRNDLLKRFRARKPR
jgi:predicted anti-sigma-YlaC factor YlaD